MRILATFVLLTATTLAAVGCATGLQGLAVLASMRHDGSQPAFSEFAADVANYSPDATDGVASNTPLEPLAAKKQEPTEPDYGFVSVSDSGMAGGNFGVSDEAELPLRPIEEAVSQEPVESERSIIDEPEAADPSTDYSVVPLAEEATEPIVAPTTAPSRFDSPFDAAYEIASEDGSAVEPAVEVEAATGFKPAADDNALAMGGDESSSDVQGPWIDDATGYPVALSQEERRPGPGEVPGRGEVPGPGEVIATPQPDAFQPGADDPDIDRFNRRLVDVPLDIRPTEGVMPGDPAAEEFAELARMDPRETNQVPGVVCSCTPWTICYRPLYFEEVALERYGDKARCIQPVISGVRFFSTVALLPYKMRVRPPRSCLCDNGFSRPGDCPLPGYCDCVWRWDAAAIEIAAVTGFVFILP